MRAEIERSMEKIAEFCHQWQVIELALFGSVLSPSAWQRKALIGSGVNTPGYLCVAEVICGGSSQPLASLQHESSMFAG